MNQYKRKASRLIHVASMYAAKYDPSGYLEIHTQEIIASVLGEKMHDRDVILAEERFGPFIKMCEEAD